MRKAIVPVEVIAFQSVTDAMKALAPILPLVVIVPDTMADIDRTSLGEVAQAAGAEMFDLDAQPGASFQRSLLDAVMRSERRRFKRA